MTPAGATELNRIAFWQGQVLRASDFRTEIGTAEQLRWWHNRSLHNTYGVRFGLDVSSVADAQGQAVLVSCGIAYDCFGRELLVSQTQRVPLPVVKEKDTAVRTLVVVWRDGHGERPCCEGRPEPCWPATSSHENGRIEFSWTMESDLHASDGVPIARLAPGGKTRLDPRFVAPASRPIARPLLASGETIPGNTPWEVWFEDFQDARGNLQRRALGMQTRIDTSAAGFTRLPRYFAQLQGPLWDGASRLFMPAFFPSIANATTTEFTFRLLMRGVPRRAVEFRTRAVTIQDVSRSAGRTVISVKGGELLKEGALVLHVPESARQRARDAREESPLQVVSIDDNKVTLKGSAEQLKPGDRLILAAPRSSQQIVDVGKQADLHPGEEIAILGRGGAPGVALVAGVDPRTGLAVLDFARSERSVQLAPDERFAAVAIFNTDFGAFFTAFARRQKLHVCWIGCQCGPAPLDLCQPAVDRGPCDDQNG